MPATAEGTKRYAERLKATTAAGHFREEQNLTMSSVGLGTYLGKPNDATDESYRQAAIRAVELGVNVIDTAINYRHQRSERTVGQAIRVLGTSGKASRDELIISTKAGYIAFDGEQPANPQQYFTDIS
jgi:aryl-alcohol dehydrogenase-like predicted oxidoreductase